MDPVNIGYEQTDIEPGIEPSSQHFSVVISEDDVTA